MQKKYKLYALPLDAKSIEKAAKYRFSRATPNPAPGYVLIYADGRKPNDAVEITEKTASCLSPADVQWLIDSGAAILADEIEKNKPEVLKHLSESVETLENELAKVKRNEGTDCGGEQESTRCGTE